MDSVKNALTTQKPDTNRVKTLLNLSNVYVPFYPDSGLAYGLQSLALSEKLNYEVGVFWSHAILSGSYMILGNYPQELECGFNALSIATNRNIPEEIATSNCILSNCYYNLGEYPTSLKYLNEVRKIVLKSFPNDMACVWLHLSKIFEGMNMPDSALFYAKKGFNNIRNGKLLNEENYESRARLSYISPILGNAFAGKADYDSAMYYYRIGIPASINVFMRADMIDGYNGMAEAYKQLGNYDSAISYGKKALQDQMAKTYPAGLLRAANVLADTYENLHEADSSLKYLRLAVNVKEKLFNREKNIATQKLTFKEQEKQADIENSRIKLQNQYRMYLLIASLTAIFIIAVILLKNNRLKQVQKMRNSIADDLHDDIGSTLSSISIMSELARQKSPEAISLLSSIEKNTITIQENMSDIVWTIKSENDRFENVLQRMNQFALEILEAKNIELDFTSEASLSATKLSMEQRKNFYLFFKEVINNAAKYSDARKVCVCISKKDHHIEMNIRDDGRGFESTRVFNGHGMSTLRKRGAELNADFKITSHINEGTAVQLKFKIT